MTNQQFWKMLESTLKSPATHQLVPGIIRRAYDLDLTIPVVMNSKGQVFITLKASKVNGYVKVYFSGPVPPSSYCFPPSSAYQEQLHRHIQYFFTVINIHPTTPYPLLYRKTDYSPAHGVVFQESVCRRQSVRFHTGCRRRICVYQRL